MDDYEEGQAPWDRQKGEKGYAYKAFTLYRDMGSWERSLSKVAALHGLRSNRSLKKWSARWQWVKRCEAWDAWQEQVKQRETAKGIKEMVDRHVQLSLAVQQKLVQRLQSLDANSFSNSDFLRALDLSVQIERKSRGAEDKVAVSLTGPNGGPVQVEHGLSDQIVADPEANRLAHALLWRLAGDTPDGGPESDGGDAGGTGLQADGGQVAHSEAPADAQ